MAYKDLATVEVVEELSENAHVLVEDNGKIVRGDHPKEIVKIVFDIDNHILDIDGEKFSPDNCFLSSEPYCEICVGSSIKRICELIKYGQICAFHVFSNENNDDYCGIGINILKDNVHIQAAGAQYLYISEMERPM